MSLSFSAENVVPKVTELIREALGAAAAALDGPIFDYFVTVLEMQTLPELLVTDEEVANTMLPFLLDAKIVANAEECTALSKQLMDKMRSEGLAEERQANFQHIRLIEAVQLDKVIKSARDEKSVLINTNDEVDGSKEAVAARAKAERKARKDREARAAQEKVFNDFLASRGLQAAKHSVVKIHRSEKDSSVFGSNDVFLDKFDISVGSTKLLDNAEVALLSGRRYGLVGRNGMGKTTFLRNFAERELNGIPPYLQILHIEQEVVGDDTTAMQCVLNTDVERERLLKEEKELLESKAEDAGSRLTKVYERMDEIDAHSAEARAAEILDGLGFDTAMQNAPTKSFSGGWRMRIALARALFVSPDLLMLDEPTNHLDLHAILWLENYLQNWTKTLIVVSHARNFLNAVATDIIHLHNKKLTTYRGDYDTFERVRVESLKTQSKAFEAQQMQRAHIQKFIDRFKYKAKTARMAQSRIKMLEKMSVIPAVLEDPSFSFKIPNPDPVNPPYVQASGVSFWWPGKSERPLFKDLHFNLDIDSRIALVGPNGAGKSTFLHVLFGDLEASEGIVTRNGKVRVARFSQHHVDGLNLQQTPLEYMMSKFPGNDSQTMRAHLGSLGVVGDMALQPIYTLSGGQKSRVAFSTITFQRPHLLMLDEPSNHLDIETVSALIQAINDYEGGVLLISHDHHLISSVCDEIWVCENGNMSKFDGDFTDYKNSLLRQMRR